MEKQINKNALLVIEKLNNAGFSAYLVGGCVRDLIMSKPPHDYDISTNALPAQVQKLFSDTVDTGSQFGTILVKEQGEPIEVTTFRKEGIYEDGRHPESVEFVSELKQDVLRRDFTINGMAYHPNEGIIDYVGGMADIQNKLIRTIGNPDARFKEDSLRILRGMRFACNLNYQVEKQTMQSMNKLKENITKTSVERIWQEMQKILTSPNGSLIKDFTEILMIIFPELIPMQNFDQQNPYHHLDVYDHTMQAFANTLPNLAIRITMLFHDSGKPYTFTKGSDGRGHFYGHQEYGANIAVKALTRLKCEKALINKVRKLIIYHDIKIQDDDVNIKNRLNELGKEDFFDILAVQRADNSAKDPAKLNQLMNKSDAILKRATRIINRGDCYKLSQLNVNGDDLIAQGVEAGSKVGTLLNMLLQLVITEELKNDKKALLEQLDKLK